jgi:hypothetical protein
MKIRIMALPADARQAVKAITDADGLDVIDVSDPRPNHGNSRLVRIYIEAQLSQRPSPDSKHRSGERAVRCSFPGEPAAS